MSQTPDHIRQRKHRDKMKALGVETLCVKVPRGSRELVRRIAAELTARHLEGVEKDSRFEGIERTEARLQPDPGPDHNHLTRGDHG